MSPPSDKKMVGIQPAEDSIDLSLLQNLGNTGSEERHC